MDRALAFEVKETPTEAHQRKLRQLAKNLAIEKNYVIGRHPGPLFPGFVWGGWIG